jgi:hypothetical protein
MQVDLKQCARGAVACILAVFFAVPQTLMAQAAEHVVNPSELQQAVLEASQTRQRNLEQVEQFLSSDMAKKALRSAHMDPEQVIKAVPSLSNAELAQLAARTQKAQADFAAGNFTDRDLLLLLVAIAALILIIVAVR